MRKKIYNILFANIGAKIIALVLALMVWVLITGKEKVYTEQGLSVPVDIVNIPQNIEVQRINPVDVRMTLRGSSHSFKEFKPEKVRITIDLKGITHGGKINFYTEDFLQMPQDIEIASLHPKQIEIYLEELASREVPVRPNLINRLPEGFKLKDARCSPDKVTIFGLKNLIDQISCVYTQGIDLGTIKASAVFKVPLKQPANVSKFLGNREAEVTVEIEEKTQGEK